MDVSAVTHRDDRAEGLAEGFGPETTCPSNVLRGVKAVHADDRWGALPASDKGRSRHKATLP